MCQKIGERRNTRNEIAVRMHIYRSCRMKNHRCQMAEAIFKKLMAEICRIEKMTRVLRLSNTPYLKKRKFPFDVLKSQNIKKKKKI